MFRKFTLAAAVLAMGTAAIVPAGSAEAQRRWRGDGYSQRYYDGDRRDFRRGGDRCRGGDTGLLVGAVAGGLLGRTIDTRGDRTLGTLLGAGAGALAGRAVERSDQPRYCRR